MSNKFSKLYISRAFQNGIASQNISIFVKSSLVNAKNIFQKNAKKEELELVKFVFLEIFQKIIVKLQIVMK